MSIHWPIIKRLASRPLAVACTDDRRSYKGIELLVAAWNLAGVLQARCHSRTVGVLCPTSAATPIAALAGWILGKTVVPLNFLLSREELQYVIDDCGADTVLTVQPLLDHMGFTPKVKNLIRFEDLSLGGVPEPLWPASASDDDLAVLLYTSGTSGRPKGVMLTHGNLTANVSQVLSRVPFTKDDLLFGVLPQFHSFGLTALTLLPLTGGFKVVFASRFVPQKVVKTFREMRPTFFVAIPSMYNALLSVKDATPEDFASLKYPVSGGEPLPQAVADRVFERFGIRIVEGYGLTETSPVSNVCLPWEYKPHSVGPAVRGLEQIIADPTTGADLGPNTDGEVRMRGPNVMKGYYNLPEETARCFDDRGFLKTGDMGRIDDDGHLYITGRIKEMMIVGGENVFPREIEEILNRHPAVEVSGVVGQTDPIRGETPLAFVQIREGAAFNEHELQSFCRQSLAGYKVPREIRRIDQMPRNPTGKVMRRELKKLI